MDILDRETVLAIGRNMDEFDLFTCSQYVDRKTGEPYTGIMYALFNTGEVQTYYHLKNGYDHGESVQFHGNGRVKIWELTFCEAILLWYKEWDEEGNLIEELKLSEWGKERLKKFFGNYSSDWYEDLEMYKEELGYEREE